MWEGLKTRLGLGKLTIAEILEANRPRRSLSPSEARHGASDKTRRVRELAIALPHQPVSHVLQTMQEHNISELPVFGDEATPIGTILEDQILNLALQGKDLHKLVVADVMAEPIPAEGKTSTVGRLADVLGEDWTSIEDERSDAEFAAALSQALEPGLAEGKSLDDILAADFGPLDAASTETPECLKPEEVLAYINSEPLSPNRLDHLRSCSWCSTLVASARPVDDEFRRVIGRVKDSAIEPTADPQPGAVGGVRRAVGAAAAKAAAAGGSSSARVALQPRTRIAWPRMPAFLVPATLALIAVVTPLFLKPESWLNPQRQVAGVLSVVVVVAILRLLAVREHLDQWGWAGVLKQIAPAGVVFAAFLVVQSTVTQYVSTKVKSDVTSLSPFLATLSMAGSPKIPLPEGDQKLPSSILSYANAMGRQDRATAFNAAALLAGNQENYDKGIQLVTLAIGARSQDPEFFNTRGVLYYHKSRYEDALQNFETAKSLLDSSHESPSFRGMVLGNTALASKNLGLSTSAKDNFYSSLEAFPMLSAEKLHYLLGLGQLLLDTGHAREADKNLADALQLAQSLHDESGEADVHRSMAELSHFLGDTSDAVAQVKLALKGHHSDVEKAIDLGVLARFEFDLGLPSEALKHADQSLSLSKSAAYQKGIAEQLHLKGQIAGRLDDAKADCDQALSIFSSLGYSRGEADVYRTLGLLQHEAAMQKLKQGETLEELKSHRPDFEASKEYYENALRLFQASGFSQGTVLAYGGIGSALAFISPDKPEQAIQNFQQALNLADKIEYPLGRANQLGNLGLMYKREGELELANGKVALAKEKLQLAEAKLQEALKIHRTIRFKLGEAKQLMNLADVARLSVDCAVARDRIGKSISIFKEIGAADLLKRATDLSETVEGTCPRISNNGHGETQPR